jgi:hypothetical protein
MKLSRFAVVLTLLASALMLSGSVFAQTTGARISGNGITVSGTFQGMCGEASYGNGVDGCLLRVGPGQYGWSNGLLPGAQLVPLTPNILLNAPAAAGTLGTATTGGSIATGTYRVGLTYVTAEGGETPIGTDSSSTQAVVGPTGTITGNAPAVQSGAVGYRIYVSAAAGAANSEVLQPLSTAVCAGAFVTAGITVCPFGANYTLTSLVSTGYATPAISGAPNTAGLVQLTSGPTTALTTVTTAQTMASWTLPAGAMNLQGKRMHIHGQLMFSNGATTPAITLSVKIGSSITPVSVVGAANANTNSNAPVNFDFTIQTTTTGTSGADEAHGCFTDTVAAAWSSGVASPVYCDGNAAASSTYDHTVANTLALNIAASAALTSVTMRDVQIDFSQF